MSSHSTIAPGIRWVLFFILLLWTFCVREALSLSEARGGTSDEDTTRPLSLTATFSSVLMPGLLKETLPGIGGGIGVRYKEFWQLEMSAAALLPQVSPMREGDISLSFSHVGLSARVTLFLRNRFGVDAIGGVRFGVLSYDAKNFAVQNFGGTEWTLDSDAGFGFRVGISRYWNLGLDASADFFEMRREIAVVDRQNNVFVFHEIPLVVLRCALSLTTVF